MNKPKFNIDAHAYWLLCEGQQVDVDGQKIQLTIVEEAKKTIDLHTDSWGVLNDGSQRFKDTVIKWINENNKAILVGDAHGDYYGRYNTGGYGANFGLHNFTHILTIDEFCALAYLDKEKVTDTPPVKSLKYEDCFERVQPKFYADGELVISQTHNTFYDNVPTERQAKQLAATIKLLTIMHDANGGEWVPDAGEMRVVIYYGQKSRLVHFEHRELRINSPIYFRDKETALRAYEENKEVFHDYFGVGGEQ